MVLFGTGCGPCGLVGGSLPEKDDESVENVEAVLYVAVEAVSHDLENHLDPEQSREEQVDVLQHVRQRRRLTHSNTAKYKKAVLSQR